MENNNKKVSHCKELKPLSCFRKHKNTKSGLKLGLHYKECIHGKYTKVWEQFLVYYKDQYYPQTQEKVQEYWRELYSRNKEKVLEERNEYYKCLPNIKYMRGKEIKSSFYFKYLNTHYHKRHID